MSVQVKGSGTIGGLDEGLVVSGIITSSTQLNVGSNIKLGSAGIVTAANFKTGVTNLHSTGLTLTGGQLDIGSNIKIGTAGVVTATSFVGSGANLTSLPAQATIANNADNRVITGGSGVNLNGEASLTFASEKLTLTSGSGVIDTPTIRRSVQNSSILISGGNATNDGANLTMYGSTHGSQAGHFEFRSGSTERLKVYNSGLQKITQSANITDGSFYSTVTISSPNGVYQGIRFDRGNVAKWRIGMKNDDTFQIANLFHNGSASAEDNCVRITDNDDINITGNLKISTAGNGIDFSATTNYGTSTPAEILDDYEEGQFQPSFSVASGSITRLTNRGEYCKVGRVVHCMFSISANGSSNPSGTVTLTGLPFTGEVPSANGPRGGGGVVFAGYHAPPTLSKCIAHGNTLYLMLNDNSYLQANTSGTGFGYNAYQISGFFSYLTAT